MKNSSPYDGDSFAFHKKVCDKKQIEDLKDRLRLMDSNIRDLYSTYDQHFIANSLEVMNSHGYADQSNTDLKAIYNYKSTTLSKLRIALTTTASGRVIKCQNCTINNVHTFDHLVPQSEFPEFIVHPRNLMCSCGDCNSRKSNVWRNGGVKTTLNLYLDQLPNVRYLFVNTEIGNSSIEVEYYLENRNGVEEDLFALLKEHYKRLNLFERFAEDSHTVITSFRTMLEPLMLIDDVALRRAVVNETIRKEQLAFGINYWQSVLKLELFNNDDFMIDYEL